MASSSLGFRRLLSSTVIVPRSLRSVRPAAATRLFNANAVGSYEDGDDGVDSNDWSNRHVNSRHGDDDCVSDFLLTFTATRSSGLTDVKVAEPKRRTSDGTRVPNRRSTSDD